MDLLLHKLPAYAGALAHCPLACPTIVQGEDLRKSFFDTNGFQNALLVPNACATGYSCDPSVDWNTLVTILGGMCFYE